MLATTPSSWGLISSRTRSSSSTASLKTSGERERIFFIFIPIIACFCNGIDVILVGLIEFWVCSPCLCSDVLVYVRLVKICE